MRNPDLGRRALVGVAAALAALLALTMGGVWFWIFATTISAIALAEWSSLVGCSRWRALVALAAFVAVMLLALPSAWSGGRDVVALLAVAGILVAMVIGNSAAGAGLVYAGWPALGLIYLRGLPNGLSWALWPVVVVVFTDTGAYFAGRALGGPLLMPRLSPKKTWAGRGGGMVAAGIGGALVAHEGGLPMGTLVLGPSLAILAQAGDLFESGMKRRAGVKDSGWLLPGHGGILDRIDGLVPVAIFVAACVAGGVL